MKLKEWVIMSFEIVAVWIVASIIVGAFVDIKAEYIFLTLAVITGTLVFAYYLMVQEQLRELYARQEKAAIRIYEIAIERLENNMWPSFITVPKNYNEIMWQFRYTYLEEPFDVYLRLTPINRRKLSYAEKKDLQQAILTDLRCYQNKEGFSFKIVSVGYPLSQDGIEWVRVEVAV